MIQVELTYSVGVMNDTVRDLEVRTVTTPEDLLLCKRLRARVYVKELGWVAAADLVDGVETDPWDDLSTHACATVGADVVGTFRVILPGIGLPVQEHFGIDIDPGRRSAELSRLIVDRPHRSGPAMLALLRWAYHRLIEHTVDDAYAILEEPFLERLIDLGFPFRVIGRPSWIFRSWNVPVALTVAEILPGLELRDLARTFQIAPFFAAGAPEPASLVS
jgi:N-acyl-L-homoserine lactone synthetase